MGGIGLVGVGPAVVLHTPARIQQRVRGCSSTAAGLLSPRCRCRCSHRCINEWKEVLGFTLWPHMGSWALASNTSTGCLWPNVEGSHPLQLRAELACSTRSAGDGDEALQRRRGGGKSVWRTSGGVTTASHSWQLQARPREGSCPAGGAFLVNMRVHGISTISG